jgi:hypothetical protein
MSTHQGGENMQYPTIELHDIVGFFGATAILLAYFFLQAKKMSADGLVYSVLNLAGALLILFSLTYAWNLTAVFIEIIWTGISLFGIIRWYRTTYK